MFRFRKKWFLRLAAVYYVSMFLAVKYYYQIGEENNTVGRENGRLIKETISKDLAAKVNELTRLSNGLTSNLLSLHGNLSTLKNLTENFRTISERGVNLLIPNVTQLTEGKIKPGDMIVRISSYGDVEVNKTVLFHHLKNSLRIWNHDNETMAFMHIGKNGGTSFRSGLLGAAHNKGCKLKSTGGVQKQSPHECPGSVPCVCNRHYDWTVIDDLESRNVMVAPVSLLRDPVKRSMSHFYFAKTLPWTKGTALRGQTIGQYLKDTPSMLNTRDVWQDGQAGVSWFSGTHIGSWVVKLNEAQKQNREAVSLDWTYILNKALLNYHKSLWVGIMEKMDQSLELLRFQSGLEVKMGHSNANKKQGAKPTVSELAALEKLMPLDIWFYSYASLVHDAKWELYQLTKSGNNTVTDETINNLTNNVISKLPKTISGCKSTRYILSCPEDNFYFQWKMSNEKIDSQQRYLLPKLWS